MPFSRRLSGSDFISQWLCSGGSAAFTLSLDFPVAFLLPPTEASAKETFPPSSALPGEETTATYKIAGRICYHLLVLLTCICSFSGSFLWRHLFLTMKYSMNEFIPPTTCVAVVCYVNHSSCKLMQHNHFGHIYVWL